MQFLKNLKKSFFGVFVGYSGGCYIQKIHRGIDPDDISNFRKIDFLKIQYFAIFRLPSYISACFDITIRRALKKHAYCLIFLIFGWR